jgi:hypothetical protein
MRATDLPVVTLYGQPARARFGRRDRVALTVAESEIWAEA